MSKWISVTERRPELNTDVLCWMRDGTMVVAHMSHVNVLGENWWFSNVDEDSETDMDNTPLYWMPLPESPTTGGRDDQS